MESFILETYVAQLPAGGLDELVQSAKQATDGTAVTHIRSYFVPEDDMCMHVFHGPSVAAVQAIADRAGLEAERIVRSVAGLADSTTERNT